MWSLPPAARKIYVFTLRRSLLKEKGFFSFAETVPFFAHASPLSLSGASRSFCICFIFIFPFIKKKISIPYSITATLMFHTIIIIINFFFLRFFLLLQSRFIYLDKESYLAPYFQGAPSAFSEAPGPVLDFGPERGSAKGTMADLGPLIRHLVSTRLPSGGRTALLSPLSSLYGTRPCV